MLCNSLWKTFFTTCEYLHAPHMMQNIFTDFYMETFLEILEKESQLLLRRAVIISHNISIWGMGLLWKIRANIYLIITGNKNIIGFTIFILNSILKCDFVVHTISHLVLFLTLDFILSIRLYPMLYSSFNDL